MHSLDTIKARNAQAAGREAAHADSDWNDRESAEIHAAMLEECGGDTDSPLWKAFIAGYLRGKQEG